MTYSPKPSLPQIGHSKGCPDCDDGEAQLRRRAKRSRGLLNEACSAINYSWFTIRGWDSALRNPVRHPYRDIGSFGGGSTIRVGTDM